MSATAAEPRVSGPVFHRRKSLMHRVALSLMWITVALSSIVLSEPAPTDVLTIGLFVLLPVVGLVDGKPLVAAMFAVWLAIQGFCYLGATSAFEVPAALMHTSVSLYLSGAAFLFAAFVARRPAQHAQLILNAYLFAAVMAAGLGLIGYFDLIPGSYDALTRYDRVSGPFKDPNVFGPFLVAPLMTCLHNWLTRPLLRGILPLALAALLSGGILLSFSRGAWVGAGIAFAIYSTFYMIGAQRQADRLKLVMLVLVGTATVGLVLGAALQSGSARQLLNERMALTQPYDEGPEGRFGGQEKAIGVILSNPFGIGGVQFSPYIHHEEPHNVYLNMLMAGGWAGGLLYISLCLAIVVAGFHHALKPTRTRGLFLIVFGALVATILQGFLIDSDHWRHFYLLMGLTVGLMAGDGRAMRRPTIVRDLSLLEPEVPSGSARRHARIVPQAAPGGTQMRPRRPRRTAKIA